MKKIFVLGLFVVLIYKIIAQTAYPDIRSGIFTYSAGSGSNFYNVTFSNPIDNSLTLQCVHSINGLSFQSANMTAQVQFDFYTEAANLGYDHIEFYSLISDSHLLSIRLSFFVFGNQQLLTWVVFSVLDVTNGTTTGSINDDNQFGPRQITYTNGYSLSGLFMQQNSTTIVVYPCLQALQIGTSQVLWFLLESIYSNSLNTISTNVKVYSGTYIRSIKLQAIIFNNIQVRSQNYYQTFSQGFGFPGSLASLSTNVNSYDPNYFFSFEALNGMQLDMTNISRLINGSSEKSFSLDFMQRNYLRLTTNFLQNQNSFQGTAMEAYYLVFTKYKASTLEAVKTSSIIIVVAAAVISVLAIVISSIVIYKKCEISKRLRRKPFDIKNWQNIRFQA